jgi:uncharacterized membrane protein
MASLYKADTAAAARLYLRMCLPALVLVWVFGMGLIGAAEDNSFEMSDGWVAASLVLWVVLLAIGIGLIRPALATHTEAARSRLAAGLGVSHLLLVVAIYLMVVQPGG